MKASESRDKGGAFSEHRHVVLDTNIFRKHIGGSWEFPEALGAMAHRGEITIHVPWIVDKEFVSSIPEHVGELLNKEAGTRALARMTQASSNPQQLDTLRAELDKGHEAAVDEMRARYEQWKKGAHVQIGPDPAAFAGNVFDLYFAGAPPFEKPRQREHLPDAFIYVELQQFATEHRRVCFVSDDDRLRECVANLPGVEVFKRLFDVLKRKPLPPTERHALIARLSARSAVARRMVEEDLVGLRLLVAEQPHSIAAVKKIESIDMDKAGFVRLENGLHLTVWEATAILDAHPALEMPALADVAGLKTLTIRCSLEVQLILFAGDEAAAGTAIEELDLFECNRVEVLGERAFDPSVIRAPRIEPRVSVFGRERLDANFASIRDGLVVVGGSRAEIRRDVASYLATKYLQFRPGLSIATFLETPARHSFVAAPPYKRFGSDLDEWIQREVHLRFKPSVLVVDRETPGTLTDIMEALVWTPGLLVIATVANASGDTDLIRRVYQETPRQREPFEKLRAVSFIKKSRGQQVEFSFETGSCWGDGTWNAVVTRDEWLHPPSESTP
jgi:hypothetical protein